MDSLAYKIITLGSYGVGKTCLLLRVTGEGNIFPDKYLCTIGVDLKSTIHVYKNTSYKLIIWDTAGQERFFHINRLYYKDTNAVILVYDVTNPESFNKILFFLNDFKTNCRNNCAYLLVGNKSDCEARKVQYDEGLELAKSLGIPFIECSAYTGANIDGIFDLLIESIHVSRINKIENKNSIFIEAKNIKKPVKKCC
jgi:small GTP-binding protein